MSIFCIVKKIGPILPPLVGLMAGREGGRATGEIQVDFEILKFFYNLNSSSSDFYFA